MKKCLALILCFCVIASTFSIFTQAIDIEIDLSDLFNPPAGGDNGNDGGDTGDTGDSGDTGDTGDSGDTDDSGDSGDTDDSGDTGDTGDNGDTGEDSQDKPSSSRPGNGIEVDNHTSGNSDKDKEKEEEKKEEVVYNSKFDDVTEDKWFYSYVTELASKGIVEGYEDGSFRPQNNVTRAEFIKLLVVCMDYPTSALPSFDDVKEKDWFYSYVSTAVKNGIVVKEEYGNSFKPNEVISREEAAKLLVRAAGIETGKFETPYADSQDEYVVALYTICLMQGTVDTESGKRFFNPETGITRAETSTVFSRLLQYKADPEKFVEEKMEEYGLEELKTVMAATSDFNNEIYGIGVSPMSFYFYTLDKNADHNFFSNSLLASYESAFSHLPEIFTFTDIMFEKEQIGDSIRIKVFLKSISDTYSLQDLLDIRQYGEIYADKTVKELFGGIDLSSLSDIEKARIIYSFLVRNTAFVDESESRDIHYTALGVFSLKQGTCQGFSSAFNMLARSAGLDSCAVSFDNHSFNCILTGGEYLFFDGAYEVSSRLYSPKDSTSVKDEEYSFFALSHDKMQNVHGNFSLPLAFWCTLE